MNVDVIRQIPNVTTAQEQASYDDDESLYLSQYFRTIKRAKWKILAVILLCIFLGGLISYLSEPTYRASAKILADPRPPNATQNEQNIPPAMVFLFFETQYEIINSRSIAESVVDKLNLVENYKQEQLSLQQQAGQNKFDEFTGYLSKLLRPSASKTDQTSLSDSQLRTQLAANIQEKISVSGGKKSQIINISYESPSPQKAADIVNAVAESYIQYGLESRLREVKNTEAWLGEQFAQLKKALQESEARLIQYRSQQGLVGTGQQQILASSQLDSLYNELIRAQTDLSSAEEQYLAVKNAKPGSDEFYSLGPVLQNQTTRDQVKERARLLQRVNELLERYGEKHPKMIAARAELKSANENLNAEVKKVVTNIENNYLLAKQQVANINKLIAKSKEDIQSLQSENFSLANLERDVENNRRVYENFQVSLMEANRDSEYTGSNIHIIDKAVVPEKPFKPNLKVTLVLSGIFGLFLGCIMALIREAADNTFKTSGDVEEKLKLPVLGTIPFVKDKKGQPTIQRKYLKDPHSSFAESFNTIRTGLLFSDIDNPPKTILVSSASINEGKSILALNLASAFSLLGNTLLLEVDLRKPSVARNLSYKPTPGLSDWVSGQISSLDDIIHKENNNQLSIITSGTIPYNPLELLSSEKFAKILGLLKKHFDFIILDAPPTLPVSDSCILANQVDSVILTIKAEETTSKMAKEAISRLHRSHVNITGAVLTQADPQRMLSYGSYYADEAYYGGTPDPLANK